MVRHIVTWNYKDEFTDEQNLLNAQKMKIELERLKNLMEGIISINVEITPLPSSNRDVVLNSLFDSVEALNDYQIHPEHVRVSNFIGSVMKNRACIDYYE